MKKIVLFISLLFFSITAFSQSSQGGVILSQEDLRKLPPVVQESINQVVGEKQIAGKIETANKWVGMGKEIGLAFNECLSSLTKTASDFADTKLGKFTMFLIAYKVLGTDILQVAIGLLFIIITLTTSLYIWRSKGKDKKVLISRKWNSEGKGFEVKYEILRGDNDWASTAVIVFTVGLLVSAFIMFI